MSLSQTGLMRACTDLADHALELREIRAFARPENVRSRSVLEKVGFGVVKYVAEMDRLLYRRGRLSACLSSGMCSLDAPTTEVSVETRN